MSDNTEPPFRGGGHTTYTQLCSLPQQSATLVLVQIFILIFYEERQSLRPFKINCVVWVRIFSKRNERARQKNAHIRKKHSALFGQYTQVGQERPLFYHLINWSTLLHMEVLRSVAPLLHCIFYMSNQCRYSGVKRCKSSAHSCVKDPLGKCSKVATHFALLVDLGSLQSVPNWDL